MKIATVLMVAFFLFPPPLAAATVWERTEKALDARGLNLSLLYDGDVYANAAGGDRRGATYVGNLYLNLTVDMERLAGWRGASVFLSALSIHGGHPSRFTGDAQGACNMEGSSGWRLEEAWVEQNVFRQRFSILAGVYDLNSEFYRLQSAGLFLNSSFGIGPELSQSGIAGPSIFPQTSLGLRFAFKPAPWAILRAAVFDGAPLQRPNGSYGAFENGDGLMLISEAALLFRSAGEVEQGFPLGRLGSLPPYHMKIALGGWYYTEKFPDISETGPDGEPVQHRGSGGVYLLADKTLFRSSESPDRQLAGFVQLGIGDGRVNRFGSYVGLGLVASGPFQGRDDDQVGLGVAMGRNGSHYTDHQRDLGAGVRDAEITLELTYLLKLTEWLALQPSVQCIISPDTDPSLGNASVFQLRFEVSL